MEKSLFLNTIFMNAFISEAPNWLPEADSLKPCYISESLEYMSF